MAHNPLPNSHSQWGGDTLPLSHSIRCLDSGTFGARPVPPPPNSHRANCVRPWKSIGVFVPNEMNAFCMYDYESMKLFIRVFRPFARRVLKA